MTVNLSEPLDNFPNLLRMELETKRINEAQFDLIANIRFGRFEYGKRIFCLKKGKLTVKLTDAEVPLSNIKLDKEFPTEFDITFQEEAGKEKVSNVNVGLKNPGVGTGGKKTIKEGQGATAKEYQVRTEGEKEDPAWVFESKFPYKFLDGTLSKTDLAIIDIKKKPCSLVSTFRVESREDIHLLDDDSSGNTLKTVFARAAIKRFHEKVLQEKPYLSKQENS